MGTMRTLFLSVYFTENLSSADVPVSWCYAWSHICKWWLLLPSEI